MLFRPNDRTAMASPFSPPRHLEKVPLGLIQGLLEARTYRDMTPQQGKGQPFI